MGDGQGHQRGKQVHKVSSRRCELHWFGQRGFAWRFQCAKVRDEIIVDEVIVLIDSLIVSLHCLCHVLTQVCRQYTRSNDGILDNDAVY